MTRVAMLTLALASVAHAAPVTFTLDPEKTELLALTEPTGLFKGASHSHVIRAQKVTGKIVYDADTISASWVTVSFPVDAMVVDEPALRAREGMSAMPSDRDREDVTKAMRSAKQLDSAKFPGISFDSTRVVKLTDGKLELTGRMGLHGVRKTITLPVTFSVSGDTFTGEATYVFNHKDFGIRAYSAVMGTVQNAEPIKLKIRLVGKAVSAADLLDPILPEPAPDAGTADKSRQAN